MARHRMVSTVLVQVAVLSSAASAQTHRADASAEPLSRECITEASRILTQARFFHDGSHKAGLPVVAGEEIARIHSDGAPPLRIAGGSTLTPASSYSLVVVQEAATPAADVPCPLHRTFVRFVQGGFIPQPPRYYGPLRAAGQSQHNRAAKTATVPGATP